MTTATKFLPTADAVLVAQTQEAMKMVAESQSPDADLFLRSRYARRLTWLEELMEKVATRGLLHAL